MSDEIAICPSCGGRFDAWKHYVRCECCSRGCAKRVYDYRKKHGTLDGLEVKVIVGSAAWKELNDPRVVRANRLARRDAEYAKLGTRVTVEVRDLRDSELGCIMRVENRGNVPIGFGAAAHVSHN